MSKSTQSIVAADDGTVRSMAMAIRLPIIAEWPEVLNAIRRLTGLSVHVISDSDVSDELGCVAVVYAAHVVLGHGAAGVEQQIAERMPSVLGQGPGHAFVRLPRYWSVAANATAAGSDLSAALTESYLQWLDDFIAGKPGTATLDPLRETFAGVVEALLAYSTESWSLEAAARMNAMIRTAEARWPDLRRH